MGIVGIAQGHPFYGLRGALVRACIIDLLVGMPKTQCGKQGLMKSADLIGKQFGMFAHRQFMQQ